MRLEKLKFGGEVGGREGDGLVDGGEGGRELFNSSSSFFNSRSFTKF